MYLTESVKNLLQYFIFTEYIQEKDFLYMNVCSCRYYF